MAHGPKLAGQLPIRQTLGLAIALKARLCLDSRMATLDNDDLKAIEGLIEVTFGEKFDETLDEKLSHLPTKDEFYTKMDEVMGELKTIREEQAVQSHQLSDHSGRIEKIESHLGISSN